MQALEAQSAQVDRMQRHAASLQSELEERNAAVATLEDRLKAAGAAQPPTFFTAEQARLWHTQVLSCKQAGGRMG